MTFRISHLVLRIRREIERWLLGGYCADFPSAQGPWSPEETAMSLTGDYVRESATSMVIPMGYLGTIAT